MKLLKRITPKSVERQLTNEPDNTIEVQHEYPIGEDVLPKVVHYNTYCLHGLGGFRRALNQAQKTLYYSLHE